MPSEKDILNALSSIIDPDFNKDIVSLGFIKNIKISENDVSFDIELTTPACPIKDEFKKQAEEKVKALGIQKVSVNMTSQKRTPAKAPQKNETGLSKVQSIIAVSSCKGGVGKSTVSAHLAHELAQRGHKVGLLDTDIHGPSIPSLFNLQNTPIYTNEKRQLIPAEKNGLKIMSFGFLLGDGPAVMRGPIVTRYVQQMLFSTNWGELEYLFIDLPPGTGDVQLTITQSIQLNGAVIITTPQTLSLLDVSRGILMFEKVNVPILGIIENMSHFLCDSCDKIHHIFGSHSKTLKDRFGLEMLAELPLLPQFSHSIDQPVANEYFMQAVDATIRSLGKNNILQKQTPEFKFNEEMITLRWKDGTTTTISNHKLRLNCRCALCMNELTGELILKEKDIKSDIAAKSITPLGNYAINVAWNDGHSSGIYPYETLRGLSK